MLYQMRFKPLAPFTTQIESYTLFGAFLLGIFLAKRRKGTSRFA